ncbi:MAG: hypothetical protein AB8B65_15230 [Kordia sp.]|uniref:hypothetical protein n=1 Tax=Kordia sp. TaxID=1965332 RepID=UPI00385B77D1
MRVIYYLKNNIKAIHVLAITFLTLTSCGTYQQATYDDGIYGSGEQRRETVEVVNDNDSNNSAYQNYFEQKSYEADDRYGDVFTDVESYSSQGDAEPRPETDVDAIGYTESYSPWGETADDITINVYGGSQFGWNNWGWGWNNWGLGWNNWGWNRWGYGWNRWGRGWGGGFNGWGWNAGFNGWGGLGWNNWCWGGFNNWGQNWRSPYGNYAYNRGRRSFASRAIASRRGNYYSRTTNRNGNRYSNSRSSRRSNTNASRNSRNTRSTRATRNTRSTRSTRATRSTRNTRNTRATRNTRSTRSTRATRSTRSTPVRSNFNSRARGSYNSSSSSSRSSGSSMRSSGGSSRSSGGSRGGGRRGGRN